MTRTATKEKDKNAKPKKELTTILSRVQRIIAYQLKNQINRITPESRLQGDLGADSLDALEILNQMEEEFGVKISEEDARKLVTVQDSVDYLTNLTEPKKKRRAK